MIIFTKNTQDRLFKWRLDQDWESQLCFWLQIKYCSNVDNIYFNSCVDSVQTSTNKQTISGSLKQVTGRSRPPLVIVFCIVNGIASTLQSICENYLLTWKSNLTFRYSNPLKEFGIKDFWKPFCFSEDSVIYFTGMLKENLQYQTQWGLPLFLPRHNGH